MKKNILITCLILIASNFFAENNQFFNEAETKFQEKKWYEALLDYEKVQNKTSIILENIAICLFHLENYPQALVALKRALVNASFKQLDALEKLEKNIDKELHIEPTSNFYFVLRKILYFIPLLVIQIFFLFLLMQILFLLIRRWHWDDFTNQEKSFLKKIIIILLLCIGLWYLKILSFVDDKAIVIKSEAIVYAGPDESFHTIEKLQAGIEVKIISKQKKMYQVKTSKILGWVNLDVLEPIINHE